MSQADLFHPFTKTVHKKSYPAISPDNDALSAKGKTVLVTGGSQGIGLAISTAFAEAGASNLIIVSRRATPFDEAMVVLEKRYPATTISVLKASITDPKATGEIFNTIRTSMNLEPDILVLCAASKCTQGPILTIPEEEIQQDFDTNVTANLNWVRHFLLPDSARQIPDNKKIINVSSCSAHMTLPGRGSYGASKEAFVHLLAHVQRDHADTGVKIFNFHPGGILTNMTRAMGMNEDSFPWDDVSLPGGFAVWLASGEADFLAGRFVYANWDVEELKARAGEIVNSDLLKIGMIGEPA
ncbi:MAG: hypothetical protein LQ349_007610 [Xanthoria aureola]|nr:MAG: hypothetical protein LQ349_007842 [Xanthoria aureola]KAI4222554.1 MAG: hypothetical protein LQ349_007610 [Xanthoria aureola]